MALSECERIGAAHLLDLRYQQLGEAARVASSKAGESVFADIYGAGLGDSGAVTASTLAPSMSTDMMRMLWGNI